MTSVYPPASVALTGFSGIHLSVISSYRSPRRARARSEEEEDADSGFGEPEEGPEEEPPVGRFAASVGDDAVAIAARWAMSEAVTAGGARDGDPAPIRAVDETSACAIERVVAEGTHAGEPRGPPASADAARAARGRLRVR
jgi:hypothetical protein